MLTVKGHLGGISFDGQSVIIEKKLKGSTRIPLGAVQAVTIERAGVGMRAIRFSVAGGSIASAARAIGSHKDAARDPNALTFKKSSLAEFESLMAAIEDARQRTASPPMPSGRSNDPAGELGRLADLRNSGALTDEEFTAAKARLLGLS